MIKGIDISSNNSDKISLAEAKRQGYDYCYIKASEGKKYKNPCLRQQYQEAKAAGLKIGFYHYCNDSWSAKDQVDNFLSAISGLQADLMPCLDIESYNGFNKDADTTTKFVEDFVSLIGGKDKVIVYTGLSYYHEKINVHGYKIWIAAYGQAKPNIVDNIMVGWQYTDNGLNGHIDVSEWYENILINGNYANNVVNTAVNNTNNSKQSNNIGNEERYVDMKKFYNGSTRENIYSSNKHDNLVGYLDPGEVCDCLGTHNGHAIVMYDASNGYSKIGFTESTVWPGCIK